MATDNCSRGSAYAARRRQEAMRSPTVARKAKGRLTVSDPELVLTATATATFWPTASDQHVEFRRHRAHTTAADDMVVSWGARVVNGLLALFGIWTRSPLKYDRDLWTPLIQYDLHQIASSGFHEHLTSALTPFDLPLAIA
ncbi:hypothetical protein Q7P37_011061 [Cladosporium fusiforme]